MRRLLPVFLLVASASLARAGVLVELTDGTKLTVESHWSDGGQVHLLRGGVDMIVAKSRIKSMDDGVRDPEVYRGGSDEDAAPQADGAEAEDAPAPAAAAPAPAKADPSLAAMPASELEALHGAESARLMELQDKSFNAAYGRSASPQRQKEADEAFTRQSQRTAAVWAALQKAKKADGDGPTVPAVEQPQ